MISNASVDRTYANANNAELVLYAKRELLGSPAVLSGTHEINRASRAARRNVGPARRVGLWVSHLAALMVFSR